MIERLPKDKTTSTLYISNSVGRKMGRAFESQGFKPWSGQVKN